MDMENCVRASAPNRPSRQARSGPLPLPFALAPRSARGVAASPPGMWCDEWW